MKAGTALRWFVVITVITITVKIQYGIADFNARCKQSEGVIVQGYAGEYHCIYESGGVVASHSIFDL